MGKYAFSRFNTYISDEDGSVIIYNSLVGSLSILEKEEFQLIKYVVEGKATELSEEQHVLLDRCRIDNYVIYSDIDELAVIKSKIDGLKHNSTSLTLTILPTVSCNFCCNYCFEGLDKKSKPMDSRTQNALIDWLDNHLEGKRNLNVTWFGGEPTLGMRVINGLSKRIIALCKEKGVSYSAGIVSNGWNLDETVMRQLKEAQVNSIQLTFDGPKRIHDRVRYFKGTREGSFDRIINNLIEYQKQYPTHTSVRINLDQENVDYAYELLDELAERLEGVPNVNVYFAPIHASTQMCKHISELTMEAIEFAKKETELVEYAYELGLCSIYLPPMALGICSASKINGLVVCPNGDVYKCWEVVTMPQYKIGNIKDTGFDLAESGKGWTTWSPMDEASCRDCNILPNCMGMCAYRFLHKENHSGQSAMTPCPSLKFDFENRLKQYLAKINS